MRCRRCHDVRVCASDSKECIACTAINAVSQSDDALYVPRCTSLSVPLITYEDDTRRSDG